jgi:hypothetical protein
MMTAVSNEVIDAVDRILAAKAAMREQRKYLYSRAWSITVQEEIDRAEINYYVYRMTVLGGLSRCKQATAMRRLRQMTEKSRD